MKLAPSLFTASFLSVVVAGWSLLDAGAPSDGPARKPALRDVTIDSTAVHLVLDRDRVPAGGAANLTITAGKPIDLQVTVTEQTGSPMSRMMPPPREVSSESVHLTDAAYLLPLTFAGPKVENGADPLTVAGQATQYTVTITSGYGHEGAAAIPVFAYEPEAYQVSIDPPAPGKAGDKVDIVVHVKSLTDKAVKAISIAASSSFATIDENPTIDVLAPGAETTITLHGTRVEPGADQPRLIQVYGNASYGGMAAAYVTFDASGAVTDSESAPYIEWGADA